MKLFRSICSAVLALALVLGLSVCALASGDTYSITIPDGFKQIDSTVKGETRWANYSNVDVDDQIEIAAHCQVNDKEDKVNPIEANLTAFEQNFRLSMEKNGQVTSSAIKLVEIGEHHAIHLSMVVKNKLIGNVYYEFYVFETQNYIHTFVFLSIKDKSDFASSVMSTVVIHDEPAELLNTNKAVARVIAGAVTGAIIGVIVALVLLFVKITRNKNTEPVEFCEPAVTLTPDYWSDSPQKPTEEEENNEQTHNE